METFCGISTDRGDIVPDVYLNDNILSTPDSKALLPLTEVQASAALRQF